MWYRIFFEMSELVLLNLPVPILDEDQKLTKTFIVTLLCDASKGFMKAFEVWKEKFRLIFILIQPSEFQGSRRVKWYLNLVDERPKQQSKTRSTFAVFLEPLTRCQN